MTAPNDQLRATLADLMRWIAAERLKATVIGGIAAPNLDVDRIRRWVREFSAILEMPEILDDLELLLRRRKL